MSCPKCGKTTVGPRWHEERTDEMVPACPYHSTAKSRTEHLHYYCVCGFDWTTPTREQFVKAGARGGPPA